MAKFRKFGEFGTRMKDNRTGATRIIYNEEMPSFLADQQLHMQQRQQTQAGLMNAWGQSASIQQALLKQKAAQEAADRQEQLKRDQMNLDAGDRDIKNRLSANQQRIQEENNLRGDALQRAGMQDAMTRFAQDMGLRQKGQDQSYQNARDQLRLQQQSQDDSMYNAEAGRELSRQQMDQKARQFAEEMGARYDTLDLNQQQFLLNLASSEAQNADANQLSYDRMSQDQGQFEQTLGQRTAQFAQQLGFDVQRMQSDQKYKESVLNQNADLKKMDREDRAYEFDASHGLRQDMRADDQTQQGFENMLTQNQAIGDMVARMNDLSLNTRGTRQRDEILSQMDELQTNKKRYPKNVYNDMLGQVLDRAELFAGNKSYQQPQPNMEQRVNEGTFRDDQGNLYMDNDSELSVMMSRAGGESATAMQQAKALTQRDVMGQLYDNPKAMNEVESQVRQQIIDSKTEAGSANPTATNAEVMQGLREVARNQAAVSNTMQYDAGRLTEKPEDYIEPNERSGGEPQTTEGSELPPRKPLTKELQSFLRTNPNTTSSPYHTSNTSKYQPSPTVINENDYLGAMSSALPLLAPTQGKKGKVESPNNKHWAKLKKDGMSDDEASAEMSRNFANPSLVQSIMTLGVKDPVQQMMKGAEASKGKKVMHYSGLTEEQQQMVMKNSRGPFGPFVMTEKELKQRISDYDFDGVPPVFFDDNGRVYTTIEQIKKAESMRAGRKNSLPNGIRHFEYM